MCLPFVTCQIMKTYHCFKTNTSLVFLKRKQTNLNINFHTDIMLHSKSAVLSDSKKHSPKVSVSKLQPTAAVAKIKSIKIFFSNRLQKFLLLDKLNNLFMGFKTAKSIGCMK